MFVSPEDDGVDEVLGSKEDGLHGVGQDGRAGGQVFEMSAEQEVREMDGVLGVARRVEPDGRR